MTSEWAVVIVILGVNITTQLGLNLTADLLCELDLLLQLQFTPLYMCVVMYTSYMTCVQVGWCLSYIMVPMQLRLHED